MATLAELDLPHLAMEDAGFAADPWPHFARAREQHPWLANSLFGHVVHDYAAMKDLLILDGSMHPAIENVAELMNAQDTDWGRFTRRQITNLSGGAHSRLRDIVAPMFTPRQANLHRPLMREVIARHLDEWAPKGAFDFEEFASYFPITVLCRLLGAPTEALPRLRPSLEALGLAVAMDQSIIPAIAQGYTTIDDFAREIVADRRARGAPAGDPDLLDLLLRGTGEGGMTDQELYDLLVFIFAAGYDTSKNVLTLIMYGLLDRPQDYARCAEDAAFCGKVVEETFRFNSVANIPRFTTREIDYRGVAIPAGTMMFFPVCVAGRDPGVAPDAGEFRPERAQDNRHMGFGRGAHICLGQFIARAQIEEGLHQIAQRITRPQRTGPNGWRPFYGVWGLRGLPITFQPAPPRRRVVREAVDA